LLNNYTIAEADQFADKIAENKYKRLYSKIHDYVYPQLRNNPFFGPNIKRLKGSLSGFYRYRIGNFRLFYTIDTNKIIVFMIDVADRKDAYN
jgi:mRNA interferase RelE/StbE